MKSTSLIIPIVGIVLLFMITLITFPGSASGNSSSNSSSSGGFQEYFKNSDLTTGNLTIIHGLNTNIVGVHVYNDSNRSVSPDQITIIDKNTISLSLSSFTPISGYYSVVVLAGGSSSNSTDIGGVFSFTASDSNLGFFTINHNLSKKYVQVQVLNNTDDQVFPSKVTDLNLNSVLIDLNSFGIISGTWRVIIDARQ